MLSGLKGYRTIAFNAIMSGVMVLALWRPGSELPSGEEISAGLDAIEAAVTAVWGIGNLILRAVTNTPVGSST